MNTLRAQYIKCFDKITLIKYLKNENYTAEAEILKSRDIDGIRFLELTELDLVRWKLTAKEKRLILNCREKILNDHQSEQTKGKYAALPNKKPPLQLKPTTRPNCNVKTSQGSCLDNKLRSNTGAKPRRCNPDGSTSRALEQKHPSDLNNDNTNDQYVDMNENNSIQPTLSSKSPKNNPKQVANNPRTLIKPNLELGAKKRSRPLPKPPLNSSNNNNKPNEKESLQNSPNHKNLIESLEKTLALGKISPSARHDDHNGHNHRGSIHNNNVNNNEMDEFCLGFEHDINLSRIGPNSLQRPLPQLPAPNEPIQKASQAYNKPIDNNEQNDEIYENPDDCSGETKSITNADDDSVCENYYADDDLCQIYEDPDSIEENQTKCKAWCPEDDEDCEDYIRPDPITDPNDKLNCPSARPSYLWPAQSAKVVSGQGDQGSQKLLRTDSNVYNKNPIIICTEPPPPVSKCPPVPPKSRKLYEADSRGNIYEAEPSKSNPVLAQSYDNHRLKTGFPPRPAILPRSTSGGNVDSLLKCQGKTWNASDELPKPPVFENKFEPTQLNIVKRLIEEDENEITITVNDKEFNPNHCPYYRNTDRKGAKQLLGKIPDLSDGAFLFRKSDEHFLAITMYFQGRFYNVKMYRKHDGTFYCKTDDEERVVAFKTLGHFVEYYKKHALTVKLNGSNIDIYLKEQLTPDIF